MPRKKIVQQILRFFFRIVLGKHCDTCDFVQYINNAKDDSGLRFYIGWMMAQYSSCLFEQEVKIALAEPRKWIMEISWIEH